MKKIISFILFLIFFAGNSVYASETILKYKYNKKEAKITPIVFVKVTKDEYYNEYEINYKLKGKIPNYRGVLVNGGIPIELPFSHSDRVNIEEDGTFSHKGYYYFKNEYDNKNIVFTFDFGIADMFDYKRKQLKNNNEICVSNPIKISYLYNEQKNNFDVIETVFYIDENGELKTKDIEITDSKSDVIALKTETLSTDYYIKLREEEEKLEKEKKRIELEEKQRTAEERRNRLLTISNQMKKGINVVLSQKYSVEEIFAAYDRYLSGELYWMNATIVQIISDSELLVCILGTNSCYYLKFVKNFKADYFRAGQTYKFFYKYRAGDDTYSYRALNGNKNTVKKYYLYGAVYMNVLF